MGFLAFIPHPIEADWNPDWAPRLAGFPVNHWGAAAHRERVRHLLLDPGSFRENEISRSMRYFPRQESEFWVEVIIQKQETTIETPEIPWLAAGMFGAGRRFPHGHDSRRFGRTCARRTYGLALTQVLPPVPRMYLYGRLFWQEVQWPSRVRPSQLRP